jgi:hypothetical protein
MQANEMAEILNGEYIIILEVYQLHWYDFGLRMSSSLLLLQVLHSGVD